MSLSQYMCMFMWETDQEGAHVLHLCMRLILFCLCQKENIYAYAYIQVWFSFQKKKSANDPLNKENIQVAL